MHTYLFIIKGETPAAMLQDSTRLMNLIEYLTITMTGRKEEERFVKVGSIAKEMIVEVVDPLELTTRQEAALDCISEYYK